MTERRKPHLSRENAVRRNTPRYPERSYKEGVGGSSPSAPTSTKFSDTIDDEDITLFVDFVRSASTVLDDPPARRGLAPDPGGCYLLAVADAARAAHVVTGDQALLTVSGSGFKVSSPRQ